MNGRPPQLSTGVRILVFGTGAMVTFWYVRHVKERDRLHFPHGH
jgi:hypothetical protein